MPVLEREEYIEQAYFFHAFRERLVDGLPAQEILARVSEELLSTTKLPLRDRDGNIIGTYGISRDITQRKRTEEQLERQAFYDPLTELPNRALFINGLDSVLALGKADPAIKPTLMVIDLDRFKQVNSSVGMAVGDSILLTIARRLSRLLKPQDVLARLAGDKFGLVLLSVRDAAQITAFAETLRKALRAPIAFNDR